MCRSSLWVFVASSLLSVGCWSCDVCCVSSLFVACWLLLFQVVCCCVALMSCDVCCVSLFVVCN